jgi:UDPglucose 6-dehydrogenase
VDKVAEACGGSIDGCTIAVLGLTFKPNTDDMRDSPSLEIVPGLRKRGAIVRAYDPQGMAEAKKMLDGVVWCEDAYETMRGADALVIVTEWDEFRALDLHRVADSMRGRVLVDLRNVYDPEEAERAGLDYYGIGRAPRKNA